eukprot:Hpha_TRINITY_DN16822_c0_g15::TRINITY_DN16822_c0_g15_i1::g.149791::m.149791
MSGRAGGRIRTESMIDRLGKKPISEGFELWDKEYTLGALRLLQCKVDAQTAAGAPPFEVAQALDAVGEIMLELEENEEAAEHFQLAAEKYRLIQKSILADLMECKAAGSLEKLDKLLAPFDEKVAKGSDDIAADAKKEENSVGRAYLYRAQLLLAKEDKEGALAAADLAIQLGATRVHLAHHARGTILEALGKGEEAHAAHQSALKERSCYFPALEASYQIQRDAGNLDGALETIDAALALHPQATLIREKAFILSEKGQDEEALQLLDKAIESPPHEETESLGQDTVSECTLLKAKAAVLADLKRFDDALKALDRVLEIDADDEPAAIMKKDIAESQ